MRWQWVARVGVAAIGLTCAVAIYIYTRNAPRPKDPQQIASVDPNAIAGGTRGDLILQRKGKSDVRLVFGSTTAYKTGETIYNNVDLTGLEGSRFSVHCDVLELRDQAPGAERARFYNLKGHVKVTTDDGLQLEAEQGSYDDRTGVLSIPGAITFAKGRITGRAVGATYDRDQDAFRLLDQAAAKVAPDAAGKGAADASSTRMSMVRSQHALVLDGRANVIGDTSTMSADVATFSFTEDETAVKFVELRGSGRVTPKAGAKDQPGMSADNVTMAFQSDGVTLQHATLTGHAVLAMAGAEGRSIAASWVDIFVGSDGHTLTAVSARDQVVVTLAPTAENPGRRITAASLTSTGDPKKGLTSATFEGDPRFTETPRTGPQPAGAAAKPVTRTGSAKVLVLTLGGQLDAIQSAEFQQNAQFSNGDASGTADIAVYNEAKHQLQLKANVRGVKKQSHVTTEEITVDAWTIDLDTEAQNLNARGGVLTEAAQTKKAGPQPAGALFSGPGKIRGAADSMIYVKTTGTATYESTSGELAKLWQGQSRVEGRKIVFLDSDRSLNAEGKVDSTWELESTADGARPGALKTYRVRAETLQYEEASRKAVYTSGSTPVTFARTDGDIELEARKLTFRLAAASRTLQEMQAETGVWVKMAGGREASATTLTYDAATEVYVLRGKAFVETAKVKEPNKSRSDGKPAATPAAQDKDCSLTEALRIDLNRKNESLSITEPGQEPKDSVPVSCSYSLRRPK